MGTRHMGPTDSMARRLLHFRHSDHAGPKAKCFSSDKLVVRNRHEFCLKASSCHGLFQVPVPEEGLGRASSLPKQVREARPEGK